MYLYNWHLAKQQRLPCILDFIASPEKIIATTPIIGLKTRLTSDHKMWSLITSSAEPDDVLSLLGCVLSSSWSLTSGASFFSSSSLFSVSFAFELNSVFSLTYSFVLSSGSSIWMTSGWVSFSASKSDCFSTADIFQFGVRSRCKYEDLYMHLNSTDFKQLY
mgnify:CR=1 FL=1